MNSKEGCQSAEEPCVCVCVLVDGGRSQLPGPVLEVLSFSACVGDPSVCPCVCVKGS